MNRQCPKCGNSLVSVVRGSLELGFCNVCRKTELELRHESLVKLMSLPEVPKELQEAFATLLPHIQKISADFNPGEDDKQ